MLEIPKAGGGQNMEAVVWYGYFLELPNVEKMSHRMVEAENIQLCTLGENYPWSKVVIYSEVCKVFEIFFCSNFAIRF